MNGERSVLDRGSANSSTSSSLLERVQAREAGAWDLLCRLYGPLVYGWCRRSALQDADAADVVQEVFQVIARSIDTFRRAQPGDSFRGWLWGITRNKISDHFRRLSAEPAGVGGTDANDRLQQLPASAPDSSAGDSSVGQSLVVKQALQILASEFEPRTWQAFWRMAIDGRPAPEVAAELGMTPKAVRQAKYRVLSRLRSMLDER